MSAWCLYGRGLGSATEIFGIPTSQRKRRVEKNFIYVLSTAVETWHGEPLVEVVESSQKRSMPGENYVISLQEMTNIATSQRGGGSTTCVQ